MISAARKTSPYVDQAQPDVPPAKPFTFPAPVRGWVTNDPLSTPSPGGALVLENWFPQQSSIRMRGGLQKTATVTDPCLSLMAYVSGTASQLFAATETDVYDVTPPVADVDVAPAADVAGQTAGVYSSTMFATAGGTYLVAVNGADLMLQYDGATWRSVDAATTSLAYDAETGTFTTGLTVTGGTSGATGIIVELIDAGATGTLRLRNVTGTFQDNEIVTDSSTGSATTNIPSGVTTYPGIAGVDTADLSFVWSHKNRMFFIEADSLTAWYLPVDSVGGTAAEFSLAGVFREGGKLLIGGTWSTDAGDGMDDVCLFISDQGEVAVFQGTNPASAADWVQAGRYDIGRPLGAAATLRAGGDFVLATEDGLLPVSASVQKDRAALSLSAISRAIEPDWKEYVRTRTSDWSIAKWTARNLALIAIPATTGQADENLVVNLQTGAWAKWTGWQVSCSIEFEGAAYIGTADGEVFLADTSGSDNGELYFCTYVGLHEAMGAGPSEKNVGMARATFRYSSPFAARISVAMDYRKELASFPSAAADNATDVWDTGTWDVAVFDAGSAQQITTGWISCHGSGFMLAPIVQITSGTTATPKVELFSVDVTYETGGIVV